MRQRVLDRARYVAWVFGRKRKARFEADVRTPLDHEKGEQP
jgi:hypothetical protein